MNKLFDREDFIDSVGVKSAEFKDEFFLEVSMTFCVPFQIVILWIEWVRSLKWRATD